MSDKSLDQLLQEQQNMSTEETRADEYIQDETMSNGLQDQVMNLLKEALVIHWEQTQMLTAIGEHLDRWGYKKIASIIKADAEEEHDHARIVLKRLEFFDTTVTYNAPQVSWPRHDIIGILNAILASVIKAATNERSLITAARNVGDELTANVTIPLLEGSEKGIIEMQSYLKQAEQMSLQDFLSTLV